MQVIADDITYNENICVKKKVLLLSDFWTPLTDSHCLVFSDAIILRDIFCVFVVQQIFLSFLFTELDCYLLAMFI